MNSKFVYVLKRVTLYERKCIFMKIVTGNAPLNYERLFIITYGRW